MQQVVFSVGLVQCRGCKAAAVGVWTAASRPRCVHKPTLLAPVWFDTHTAACQHCCPGLETSSCQLLLLSLHAQLLPLKDHPKLKCAILSCFLTFRWSDCQPRFDVYQLLLPVLSVRQKPKPSHSSTMQC